MTAASLAECICFEGVGLHASSVTIGERLARPFKSHRPNPCWRFSADRDRRRMFCNPQNAGRWRHGPGLTRHKTRSYNASSPSSAWLSAFSRTLTTAASFFAKPSRPPPSITQAAPRRQSGLKRQPSPPFWVAQRFHCVRENQSFVYTAGVRLLISAAKRRKNAAHGVSRGCLSGT